MYTSSKTILRFVLGLQKSVIVGSAPYGLGLNETIMPQYLKKLGYKTHIVGKVSLLLPGTSIYVKL